MNAHCLGCLYSLVVIREKAKLPRAVLARTPLASSRGLTLFELLVAIVLLGIISTMIYSALNVGIRFSEKGSKKIVAMSREHGLFSLLYRQIRSARFDARKREPQIFFEDDTLKIQTRVPIIYRASGLVFAMYRFNPGDNVLYYTEMIDFYNPDYDEDFVPDFEDMIALAEVGEGFSLFYDPETIVLQVGFDDTIYEFTPKIYEETAGD